MNQEDIGDLKKVEDDALFAAVEFVIVEVAILIVGICSWRRHLTLMMCHWLSKTFVGRCLIAEQYSFGVIPEGELSNRLNLSPSSSYPSKLPDHPPGNQRNQ